MPHYPRENALFRKQKGVEYAFECVHTSRHTESFVIWFIQKNYLVYNITHMPRRKKGSRKSHRSHRKSHRSHRKSHRSHRKSFRGSSGASTISTISSVIKSEKLKFDIEYTDVEKVEIGKREVSPECTEAITKLHEKMANNTMELHIIKSRFRPISGRSNMDLLLGDHTHDQLYDLNYSDSEGKYFALNPQ